MRAPISDVLLGNYEPLIELASGGMATVYVARQVGAADFERLVVIKRVHPHLLRDREFHDMLRDEARVCSTIRHPNVVPVINVVEAEGEVFLVLEYVEGLALSALLKTVARRGVRLAPNVVARIVADALAGLHAAHEAKDLRGKSLDVIHRDVSPQNILVGLDGTSRIIDFGIARAASRISVTNSGIVKGKLRYMSPEQVQRKALDRRADVFSAGVVLYEAVTGQRPFEGEDDGDVVLGVLIGEVPPPSSLVAGLPETLDAVVDRALARNPDQRFRTALEFQEAIERALSLASVREVAGVVETFAEAELEMGRAELRAALENGPDRRTPSGTQRPPTTGSAPRGRSVRKSARWAVAALAVAAAGILGTALGRRTGASARIEASPTPATPMPTRLDLPGASSAIASSAVAVATAGASVAPAPVTPAPSSLPTAHPSQRPEHVRSLPQTDLHRHNPYGMP